jgi:hypothetical protein
VYLPGKPSPVQVISKGPWQVVEEESKTRRGEDWVEIESESGTAYSSDLVRDPSGGPAVYV